MKTTIACLALLAASCATGSDVEWVDYGENPALNPDYLAASRTSAMPGEAHAELAKGVGNYEVKGRYWVSPDQPPMETTARATVEMILGGRYLLQHYESSFQGAPYNGVMLMGHDNLNDEYWSLWIDSTSTGYSLSRGRDTADGAIELAGELRDPTTPGGRPYRTLIRRQDDGSFTLSMFDTRRDGSEFQVMELTYRKL